MITTRILTDQEPLDNILAGAEKLYKAVAVTMGPRGHNVIFKKQGKRVGVTHDGVTVAKAVAINNEAEAVGAELLREAAMKMDALTGDGTTTVTVLAYHILNEAAKLVRTGTNPMVVKLALEAALPEILKQIDKVTDQDMTEAKVVSVATVAAGSKDIGEQVGKLINEVGNDTPIMLGFSESPDTLTDVINGFKIESGPASPYLLEGAGLRLEVPQPKIVVVDAKLRDKEDVLPLLRVVGTLPPEERKILLIVSDIASDALSYAVVNRLKGFAEIAIARVPAGVSSHADYLADVATVTGATVLSRNTGNSVLEPELDHFGSADKVIIEPFETVIVNGHGIPEDVAAHVKELETFAKKTKDALVRQRTEQRIKSLRQKIVSILVGGQTEAEAEERHYRYEDAVGASRAALRGGIVPGGGTLLYSIGNGLRGGKGAQMVLSQALKEPMLKVLENAGVDVENSELDPNSIQPGRGFDVLHPEDGIVDLVQRGIVDPAESEKECVKTAIAIAGLLLTAGAMIVDNEVPDSENPSKLSFNPSGPTQG